MVKKVLVTGLVVALLSLGAAFAGGGAGGLDRDSVSPFSQGI